MQGQVRYNFGRRNRAGMVLLVTLVLLVVLSTVAYTLSSRVAAQRHRDQYIIDYSQARYSCDSAVKYALATLEELEPVLISRPNVPDFSDIFAIDEEAYQELIARMVLEMGKAEADAEKFFAGMAGLDDSDIDDKNDVSDGNDAYDDGSVDLVRVEIPGPYGPPWPYVTEPIELEIGSATVTIEVEDENAKYPLGWALLADPGIKPEAQAGFATFCEWMRMSSDEIDDLRAQLDAIGEIRPFKIEFKPITKTVRSSIPAKTSSATASKSSGTRRTRRTPLTRISRKTITPEVQLAEQSAFYARLFHSSMLDSEALARPTIISDLREESALKYLGTWASLKVNINTAPRHVLETAFIFGGDAARIAQEIIIQRRIEPFESIDALKKSLYGYTDSIDKCEKFITTESRFFTIRVTAVSGTAKASSIIAITKKGKKVQRVAVINI